MKKEVYKKLPSWTKPITKKIYIAVVGSDSINIRGDFLDQFFDTEDQFQRYSNEFDDLVSDIQSEAMDEFYEMVPENQATFGGMNIMQARALYAVVRTKKPEIVVETGVCNGVSTLVVLMALEQNEFGTLYSIDYPTFSDNPVPKFQKEQYSDDHTFSAIPQGKNPGWIVPEELRNRWDLRTGKSQRKLPELLKELNSIDIFIHDSDHTFPCMMFEYEVAWEFLTSDGILLSDDINLNDAFSIFGDIRATKYGEVTPGFGYAIKSV